ncbi:MAG TPA: ADP-ribosylglycohydrolase family protein [Fimbriiglobus sp.]|jgi:ADP-ribosylglycohydrolase
MTPLDEDAIVGCLLGQAVGDAMGLPAENLPPKRIARLFPNLDRPQFFFGYGMGSDDTEHACMTSQALLRSGGDVDRFRNSLAWRLRWWLIGMPAGIGLATLKSCVKLWLGFPPTRSGVHSAGNGPAMRAAVLGVAGPAEPEHRPWVIACTQITHTDPQAFAGAFLVAFAARVAARGRTSPINSEQFWTTVTESGPEPLRTSDLFRHMRTACEQFQAGGSLTDLVAAMKLRNGVSGYIAHTIPVAIFAFLKHPDEYRTAVESVIRLGGDTDTGAAITGALVGTRVGKAGIPKEWLDRYADWPRSASYVEALGKRLAEGSWRNSPQPDVSFCWWAIPFRNLFFFIVVLVHAFRRLLPPY